MQTFSSSQLTTLPPPHLPPAQPSLLVHRLSSVQVLAVGAKTQPVLASHPSFVHGLLSLHARFVPGAQPPETQVSPWLHTLPSSHVPAVTLCVQPLARSQPSAVHGLPSLQLMTLPLHVPLLQVSLDVQALPSAQGPPSRLAWAQPLAGLQVSVVQGLPSSQPKVPVTAHVPLAQPSPVVQRLPSVQVTTFGKCVQPLESLQPSSVHKLPSSQLGTLPRQVWWVHKSETLHFCPSSQGIPSASACLQPPTVAQLSLLHTLPSSQSTVLPGAHLPLLHESNAVHALPSSQSPDAAVCVQPRKTSQESVVQTFPSSHFTATPGTQPPSAHASFAVHASPSTQGPLIAVLTHPLTLSHASLVQTVPSSQEMGLPLQTSPLHVSLAVHASPSLQLPVKTVWVQPLAMSHASLVQTLPSSHRALLPAAHLPPLH